MYAHEYEADSEAALLVGIYSGGRQSDADHELALDTHLNADRDATARGLTSVYILVVDPKTESPSARWRQRMAQTNKAMKASRYYFGFVSPSAIIRGVFTAITWLTGSRPGYHAAAFETFGEACAWARTMTGQKHPQLERLYERARATSQRRPSTAPRATGRVG
jgi:hypothetical protein